MFLFLTVYFFGISLYSAITGRSPNDNLLIAMSKFEVNEMKTENKEMKTKLVKDFMRRNAIQFIFLFFVAIINIIYVVVALNYDVYKYPTVAVIVYLIVKFILNSNKTEKNKKLSTEEQISKKEKQQQSLGKWRFSIFLGSLIWTCYYGYMFYILVF